MKKVFAVIIFTGCGLWAAAQSAVSIATDISLLRSLARGQQFWAIGQTVQGNWHFSPKESAYAWVAYYTIGKSKNNLQATAKDSATLPQDVRYTAFSNVRYRQISLGWKHFLKGAYNNEETWNLYSLAGFGLMWGRAENRYDKAIDTARYTVPQRALAGSGDFKRLTLDLGLGVEMILGTGLFLYVDARTWIPASDYPSPYLYNNNTPRTLIVNGGIRVLLE